MTGLARTTILTAALIGLGACASTPDPAEVCTSEWIQPRAEKAVAKIQKRASSSLLTLRSVSEKFVEGKKPGPLQLWQLSNAVKKLNKELTQGQGITDLKTVATLCNDPEIIDDSLVGLMERRGLSDSLIRRIQNNPIYQSAISVMTEPAPLKPNE